MKPTATNDFVEIPRKPGIYKLTNKINNKSYVGKSNNLRERISIHKNSSRRLKNDCYVKRAIIKHGWENFDVSILHIQEPYDNEKLLKTEAEFIKELKTLVPNGYNILASSIDCSGYHHTDAAKLKIGLASAGRRHTEKTKKMLSFSHLGSKNPMYGKTISDEIRKTLSLSFRGEQNPFFGKTHSEETREKMKKSRLRQDCSCYKISVRQLDIITGGEIKMWNSASEASVALCGKKTSAIPRVCKGLPDKRGYFTKSALGFRWEYVM
jgi:group I intron endonuclease